VGRQIRVVSDQTSPDSSRAAAALTADLSRWLPDDETRTLDVTSLDDASTSELDAVLLLLDDRLTGADAASLTHALEARGICTMVMEVRKNLGTSRWMLPRQIIAAGTEPMQIAGLLDGLLRGREETSRMQEEMQVALRFHSGLEDRIMRMQEELQTAARIQREFLPGNLPSVHGITFGALWRPAHFVSGDIYDVQVLDDDHVGLFIADCVGHGVPAALMTMTIVHALAMRVLRGGRMDTLEPGEVLTRLNDDLLRNQTGTPRFATAVYAVLNCRTRRMRLAGAGHPAPLLISRDGSRRELRSDGGLLGIFPEATFDQVECSLHPGDRLILFTDGFEQAFPSPDRAHTGRAAPAEVIHDEFARMVRHGTPERIVEHLEHRLNDQAGSLHPHDDLTMLCTIVGEAPVRPPAERAASTHEPAISAGAMHRNRAC